MTKASFSLLNEAPADRDAIDILHAETFGPGRFARTAFRLREGVPPIAELGLVARIDGRPVGSVRFTAISIGATPALLLGPLAVLPAHKNVGIGRALVRHGLDAAKGRAEAAVLLVGDLPYYSPLGFFRAPAGSITLPGPVDPARILVAPLHEGALEGLEGKVRSG